MKIFLIVALIIELFTAVQAFGQNDKNFTVDIFDAESNRQGKVVINPKTGSLDVYDNKSNRTMTGVITPAPVEGKTPSSLTLTPLGSKGGGKGGKK